MSSSPLRASTARLMAVLQGIVFVGWAILLPFSEGSVEIGLRIVFVVAFGGATVVWTRRWLQLRDHERSEGDAS